METLDAALSLTVLCVVGAAVGRPPEGLDGAILTSDPVRLDLVRHSVPAEPLAPPVGQPDRLQRALKRSRVAGIGWHLRTRRWSG